MQNATAFEEFPNVKSLQYYVSVAQILSILYDQNTKAPEFRSLAKRLGGILAHELTTSQPRVVETTALVPVLTAGAFLLDGALEHFPNAQVCFVGLNRDHETLLPSVYKNNMRGKATGHAVILEPMLATGGSAVEAIKLAFEWGVKRVSLLSVLAAPEGLEAIYKAFPEVQIIVGQVAGGLDSNGYIIKPGIGDFGDRCAGLDLE